MKEITVVDRTEIARRLGVEPKRLLISVTQDERMVVVSAFVDGKDLTEDQCRIVSLYLEEIGIAVRAIVPSAGRP